MERAIPIYKMTLAAIPVSDAISKRDGGDGWTVLEVMCHMRDFDRLFAGRVRLTLTQDNPPLPFPDPDELTAENQYMEQDIATVTAEWVAARAELVTLHRDTPTDAWERPAQHPRRGNFTLNDQLILTPWHDSLHLEQIAKIISGS